MRQRAATTAAASLGSWASAEEPAAEAASSGLLVTGREDANLQSLDRLMVNFLREHEVPGAALAVADGTRLVFARGFGVGDRAKQTPVLPTSLFRIASISKPLTAAAVLKLVERGRLALDDRCLPTLTKHPRLVDLPPPQDSRFAEVTIGQLLGHTGGWDRDQSFDPMFRSVLIARSQEAEPPASAEHVIRYMLGIPLDFAPGERYAYSNFGYCLLGRVIEAVTGQAYADFVKQEVLAPLGITRPLLGRTRTRSDYEVRYHEDYLDSSESVFADNLGDKVPPPYGAWNLEAMDAHGGWIASAIDLLRFSTLLFDSDRILSSTSRELMLSRPEGLAGSNDDGSPREPFYGYGWLIRSQGDGVNCWHTGSLPGTSTLLVRRHDGRHWAVLFNARNTPDNRRLSAVIDPLIHEAVDQTSEWPQYDLFESAPS